MKEITNRFTGTKVKTVLTEQGRRQDWLANQIGVSQSTVTRWLKGDMTIGQEHANAISSLLGIPFSLLFESRERDSVSREQEAA